MSYDELLENIQSALDYAKIYDISYKNFEVLQKHLDTINSNGLLSNGDIAECLEVIDGIDSQVSDIQYHEY